MDAKDIFEGDVVNLRWPGSSDGSGTKRALVVRSDRRTDKVTVRVARTTPKGEYTGEWGIERRTFPAAEVVGVFERGGTP